MAKTFKTNPALQFISKAQDEEPVAPAEPMEQPAPTEDQGGTHYKKNPLYVEVKSRRVQLMWQPSLHKRVKAAAERAGLSLNEYVHMILEREMEKENEQK